MTKRNLICQLEIDGIDPGCFRVAQFSVTDAISAGLRADVEAVARESIEAQSMLGKRAALAIHLDENTTRRFHGVVACAEVNAVQEELFKVWVAICARIDQLKLGRSSRIFQDLSVVDIVDQVLAEAQLGGDAREWKIKTSYPKREHVAQYNESDFAFICRLLSEEGIGLVIDNRDDQDAIVFFDDNESLKPIRGDAALPYRDVTQLKADTVIEIAQRNAGAPDAIMLRDYDFKRPSFDLSNREQAPKATGREVYIHPGNFIDPAAGKRLAKRALERLRAQARQIEGTSDCPRMEAGRTFRIENHPRASINDEYLILSVVHRGNAPDDGESAVAYGNEFTAIPKDVPYRPAASSETFIPGVNVAFVTCPGGEEIHADDFGRVKVKFPWDRSGHQDDRSSCWLRVGQVPLGGSMVLPRGEFEVVVDFELGDPDRPFVSGHLYNAEKAPPYALPAGKTRSSLQTATTRGGPGANEVRFEDAKGSEEILFNASKDEIISVENDGSTGVGNNQAFKVGSNLEVRVGAGRVAEVVSNRSVTVGGSQKVNVGKDLSDGIGGSETVSIGGMRKLKVGGDHGENCVGTLKRTVGALQAVTTIRGYQRKIVGASSTKVGAAWLELLAKNRASEVGGARNETVGAIKLVKAKQLSCSAGAASVVNAAAEIVDCGGSRSDSAGGPLAITAGGGLSVKASTITIEAEGKLVLVAGACSFKLSSDGTIEITAPNIDLTGVETLSQVLHKSN